MRLSERLLAGSEPARLSILQHPFVKGIGDGSLQVKKFRYYVSQDYAYLIDYARVLALGSARAADLESMAWFAHLLDETLNTEMSLHVGYCARLGITERELKGTRPSPTTVAYTRFLLSTGYHGSFGELAASLMPCQWGYWEIGAHLARQGEPEDQPLYGEWIRMYSSAGFQQIAEDLRGIVDRMGDQASAAERARMEEAYGTALRYEYLFWDASYRMEGWPI
jgi:thiaminase/transcriptional activator TenA